MTSVYPVVQVRMQKGTFSETCQIVVLILITVDIFITPERCPKQ